jgi:hypothetical protein
MCRGATSATTACGGHVAVYTRQSLTLTTTLTSKGGVGVWLLMIMYISPPNTMYIGPGRDRHKNTKLSNLRIGAAGGKGGRRSEITAGWPKALEQTRSHPQVEGSLSPHTIMLVFGFRVPSEGSMSDTYLSLQAQEVKVPWGGPWQWLQPRPPTSPGSQTP